MDAITMLRDDHKQVNGLLREIDRGNLDVVPEVCAALRTHSDLEERIFYPAVRAEVEDADDTVLESLEEHGIVESLIDQLEAGTPDDESYRAKATVLAELVRHHVTEEEDELFPRVREAMGRRALQDLGERMAGEREPQQSHAG